ncbi:kinase-like protein [Stipitochalara longipes BDJ]|nr:kinase-like protein [Stipitochalara longipes BDJ]
MSVWSRLYDTLQSNTQTHGFLTPLAVSAAFFLALCIYRVFFSCPVSVFPGQYIPFKLDDVEDIELYAPGGFHPVHMGEIYHNRYKILHKLGCGGFSTVWLARDVLLSRYVALKIILADESSDDAELEVFQRLGTAPDDIQQEGRKYIGTLLDHFTIKGPNGSHLCLVSEVMGPSIDALNNCHGKFGDNRRLHVNFARKIARQVVRLCNSCTRSTDLTSSNMLFKLSPIDHWSEEDIYQRFGQPKTELVVALNRPWLSLLFKSPAPLYLVESLSMADPQLMVEEIRLVDFGLSFPFDSPLDAADVGIPHAYSAPETIFDGKMDKRSEIWTLGCVLFELRNGQMLFESRGGGKNEVMMQVVRILGRVPEIWRSAWEEMMEQYVENRKSKTELSEVDLDAVEFLSEKTIAHFGVEDWVHERLRKDEVFLGRYDAIMPPNESVQFGDLLNNIFRWVPEERLSLNDILGHPWFTMKYEGGDV